MVRPAHIPLGKIRPRQFFADKGGTYAYGYDAAYRLTSESRSGFRSYSASHTYDAMGNRLTRTLDGVTRSYTYNDADQVTGWTEGTKVGSYSYDIEGNLTQKVVTDGLPTDQWDYEFDSVGRMDTGQQSVGGTKSTLNVYAGDQWYRVSSTTGGTILKYGWSQGELLAEFDSSGKLTAGYVNKGVDQPFYKTRFSSDGSVVDARDFYHADINFRVHHVTNGSGNEAEKYVYNAYGRRTILDGANTPLTSSTIGNRIGFQGREHEDLAGPGQEAGLTFHRNRIYDPDVGHFMNRNRWGYIQGRTNLYDFEVQRPTYNIEPFSEALAAWWAAFMADLSVPEPSDAVPQKWAAWALVGVTAGLVSLDVPVQVNIDYPIVPRADPRTGQGKPRGPRPGRWWRYIPDIGMQEGNEKPSKPSKDPKPESESESEPEPDPQPQPQPRVQPLPRRGKDRRDDDRHQMRVQLQHNSETPWSEPIRKETSITVSEVMVWVTVAASMAPSKDCRKALAKKAVPRIFRRLSGYPPGGIGPGGIVQAAQGLACCYANNKRMVWRIDVEQVWRLNLTAP